MAQAAGVTPERQDRQRRDAGARPKGSAVAGCRCCYILRTTAGWARLAREENEELKARIAALEAKLGT